MKHKRRLALLMAVLMVLAMLPAVAAAEDEVYYTLDGTNKGTNSNYGLEGTVTQGSITWKVTGNVNIDPWRIGGKSITGVDRPVYSTQPMNETITKVELELGTINLTVNSLKFVVASDDSFGTIIEEQTITDVEQNNTYIFTPDEGKEWTNAYYKFVFNVTNSQSSNKYVQFVSAKFYKTASGTPTPTYTVSFDANGGTGTMANVTTASPYTLPACGFTAPEGKEFDYWAVDGGEGMYAPGDSYTLTGNTTFIAQWKDLPVVNYTEMMLKRVPANGETVVIYYPKTSKVMTGTDYFYNNQKHELVAADATLTDNILAVPEEALRLTVSVADNKYTFKTADDKYLYADGTDVLLVSEQGANTLFQLETAAAGVDNYYIKCDSACYNNDPEKPQYIEFYGGHFTVYSLYTDNAAIYTFQFFSEDGEGPTPEAQYTVTLNPGEAAGDPVTIENVTSPYHLPGCPETFTLEGKLFDGWKVNGEGETLAVGATIALSGDTTLVAQWKDAPVSETKSYALVTDASELAEGDKIILVGENEGALYALSYQKTNNRHAVVVTADEQNVIAAAIATGADDQIDQINVYELVLGGNATDGWTFYDPLFGYLYAAAKDANYLKSEATADENAKFTLDIDASGLVNPVAANSTNRNQMRFNYNGGTPLFSCYKEGSTLPGVYIYKLVEDTPEPTEPSFRGPQLSLGGQIGVIFNMYLPAGMDFTGSYMTFSIPHGNCTEEEAYNGSDSFTCYINAIQMAEPITATFHYGDNQTIEKTFAAMEYFGAFDQAVSAGTITSDAKTVTLVHALADYGHYVQLFLSEKNGWELGTDYAAMDAFYKTAFDSYDVSDYAISCPDVKTLFSKVSFSLVLDSETAIRLFLTPKEGVGDITVTCSDGKTANVTRTGSRCLVEIPNISAHQLSKTYTLTVSAGDQSVTIEVSALSYVQLMLNAYAGDTNALNAAAAIYYYAMAAKAFKEN